MSYSTSDDILLQIDEQDLIQLTDDLGSGIIDADVVTRAIADADQVIDGYLGSRYSLPFTTVPGILRTLSVDIAISNLYARRRDTIPEIRKERQQAAIRFLEMVGRGQITLGVDDPDLGSSDSAEYSADDRVFTAAILESF